MSKLKFEIFLFETCLSRNEINHLAPEKAEVEFVIL